MTAGGFCRATCGACKAPPAAAPTPAPTAAPTTAVRAAPTPEARAVAPSISSFSPPAPTAEKAPTVRYSAPGPSPEPPRAPAPAAPAMEERVAEASGPPPSAEPAPPAPIPAAEQYLADLEDAAALLTEDAPFGAQAQALPSLALPTSPVAAPVPALAPTPLLPTDLPPQTLPAAQPVPPPNALPPPPPLPPATPAAAATPALVPSSPAACNTTSAYAVLSSDVELSTLRESMELINVAGVLQNPDVTFTLLAPTNAAFEVAAANLGQTRAQLLSSRNALRDVVFTHIIPNTPLSAADLAAARTLTPQAGQPLYAAPPAEGGPLSIVSVGSTAKVTEPNYAIACNYMIHKVDTVLLPGPARGAINPAYQAALASGGAAAAGR